MDKPLSEREKAKIRTAWRKWIGMTTRSIYVEQLKDGTVTVYQMSRDGDYTWKVTRTANGYEFEDISKRYWHDSDN